MAAAPRYRRRRDRARLRRARRGAPGRPRRGNRARRRLRPVDRGRLARHQERRGVGDPRGSLARRPDARGHRAAPAAALARGPRLARAGRRGRVNAAFRPRRHAFPPSAACRYGPRPCACRRYLARRPGGASRRVLATRRGSRARCELDSDRLVLTNRAAGDARPRRRRDPAGLDLPRLAHRDPVRQLLDRAAREARARRGDRRRGNAFETARPRASHRAAARPRLCAA